MRWEISVTPDGDGAVTIVLPQTTDCGATGAVCTDDGRMLSNRLEVTVPGPQQAPATGRGQGQSQPSAQQGAEIPV